MVELKDVLLIGAVGAAGILGYKAIKGGLTSVIPSVTLPENKTAVDYELAEKYQKMLQEDRASFQATLESVLAKAQGLSGTSSGSSSGSSSGTIPPITPNPPDTVPDDDDGESNDGKKLTKLSDLLTFTLEKSGAYGQIREAEAATAEQFDTNNTERLNALGGLGGAIGLGDPGAKLTTGLASFAGLSPAAAGSLGAVESLVSGFATTNTLRANNAALSIGLGIQKLGESIYDGLRNLF